MDANCNLVTLNAKGEVTFTYREVCTGYIDEFPRGTKYIVLFQGDETRARRSTDKFMDWFRNRSPWSGYVVDPVEITPIIGSTYADYHKKLYEDVYEEARVVFLDADRIPSWVEFVSTAMAYRTPWDSGSGPIFDLVLEAGYDEWVAFKVMHGYVDSTYEGPSASGQRAWAGNIRDAFADDEPTLNVSSYPTEWYEEYRGDWVDNNDGTDCLELVSPMGTIYPHWTVPIQNKLNYSWGCSLLLYRRDVGPASYSPTRLSVAEWDLRDTFLYSIPELQKEKIIKRLNDFAKLAKENSACAA